MEYRLKRAEPALPAGFRIARAQLAIADWTFELLTPANRAGDRFTQPVVTLSDADRNYLRISSSGSRSTSGAGTA